MSKTIKKVLLVFLILVLAGFALLRPVPILPEEELTVTKGIVERIFEGGDQDIVFKLKNEESFYYINRGLEQELSIDDMRLKLLGRTVTIKYPEYWSLFSSEYSHHLSKLEHNGNTIFSEVD